MMTFTHRLALGILVLTFVACGGVAGDDTSGSTGNSGLKGGKADEWGPSDDPRLFSGTLEYRLDALPREGEAESAPWAGSYWPVYEDSVNKRWAGLESYSPAEKYGQAFGIDGVEDAVSLAHGIDAHRARRKSCKTSSDCSGPGDGRCSKRRFGPSGSLASDDDEGVCIPTWWGICHAWAPAAILEPEPKYPVTKNGVEFKVNDIKALITLAYDRTASKFISLRCNTDSGDLEYDLYDRPVDAECKNTNPGTLHVILANYLGIMKQAFAEDRTFDDEVWNQPVRSFKVTEMTELTPQEANMKVGVEEVPAPGQVVEFEGQVLADDAGEWHHAGPYSVVAGNTVKATLAASSTAENRASLYVRFGAQPDEVEFDCGPTSEASNEDCELLVPTGQSQLYISVLAHSGTPEFSVEADLNSGNVVAVSDTYMFNDNARQLFFVVTEVKYISESDSNEDGNLAASIDDYTRTDTYQYILELDDGGAIIGGEWIGSSKKKHPDFLWLPIGRHNVPVAGGKITYENIKALLDESQTEFSGEEEPTGPATSIDHLATTGHVEVGEMAGYSIEVRANQSIVVRTECASDIDLYVRMNVKPSEALYDQRAYTHSGSETLTVVPSASGTLYIGVHGYEAGGFSVYTADE